MFLNKNIYWVSEIVDQTFRIYFAHCKDKKCLYKIKYGNAFFQIINAFYLLFIITLKVLNKD